MVIHSVQAYSSDFLPCEYVPINSKQLHVNLMFLHYKGKVHCSLNYIIYISFWSAGYVYNVYLYNLVYFSCTGGLRQGSLEKWPQMGL
jgi:hypothetical protein